MTKEEQEIVDEFENETRKDIFNKMGEVHHNLPIYRDHYELMLNVIRIYQKYAKTSPDRREKIEFTKEDVAFLSRRGHTISEIAKHYGCSYGTIQKIMKKTYILFLALCYFAINDAYSNVAYRKVEIRTDLMVNLVFIGPDKKPVETFTGDGASLYLRLKKSFE